MLVTWWCKGALLPLSLLSSLPLSPPFIYHHHESNAVLRWMPAMVASSRASASERIMRPGARSVTMSRWMRSIVYSSVQVRVPPVTATSNFTVLFSPSMETSLPTSPRTTTTSPGRTDHRLQVELPTLLRGGIVRAAPALGGQLHLPGDRPCHAGWITELDSLCRDCRHHILSHPLVAAVALAVALGVLALQVGAPPPEARHVHAHGQQHRRLLVAVLARANVALIVDKKSSEEGGSW